MRFARHKGAVAVAGFSPNWQKLALRAAVSLLISGGFFWLLAQRLADIDLVELRAGFSAVPWRNWSLALGLTGLSFWAVGHYDSVLHRHFNTGLPERLTRSAGICAIAVSQTLGLGLITGSILRWRMLPGQNLWQATRLTAAVGISFLAGWAVVTATTLLILPQAPFKPLAAVMFVAALGLIVLCLLAPARLRFCPNGQTIARLVVLTAIDTFAAAAAFYLLCGPEVGVGFAALLPVFLLAFGAGLISGTPGGVGPFEMTLLALLPSQAEVPLLAAVLAWRAVYFAIPAILGAIWAVRGPKTPPASLVQRPLHAAGFRAELGLQHQGEHHFLPDAAMLAGVTQHFLIGLFDPATPPDRRQLTYAQAALHRAARARAKIPILYKCSARSAAIARAQGNCCMRIAQEAWLSPGDFHLKQSNRSGLRRKLRRAEVAGVCVTKPGAHPALPWDKLAEIAATWAAAHGGERGFSMGRYCQNYLAKQRLYVAWCDGAPIAFASFHQAPDEWTLDLMRYGTQPPDGTMHLLVQSALQDAAAHGVARLSLAAAPDFAPRNRFAARLLRGLLDSGHGLTRFKASFAPHWQPLYIVAPNRAALTVAVAEIARAILHPRPLRPIQYQHEEYEFASFAAAWHRHAE